jgi:type I site-specific restriction endonuclease
MNFDQGQIQLPSLNLPPIQPILQEKEGKMLIFDSLRKKYLVLSPEEWVRQHWISFLITELKFPRGLVSLEKGLKYNQLQKRTDLVIWDKSMNPYLLIECKSPKIKLSQKTLEQACMYQKELQTKFLILSNGIHHISLSWNTDHQTFVKLDDFPQPPE